MRRLTNVQAFMLIDLSCAKCPILPSGTGAKRVCRNLEKLGFVRYSYGHPIGFSITDEGLAVLTQQGQASADA